MFYYVNPGFIDDKGHHLTHQSILYQLYKDELCVLGNKNLEIDDLPYKVIKCFNANTWQILQNPKELAEFEKQLLGISKLLKEGDRIFMYMGDALFIASFLKLSNSLSLSINTYINLFHSGKYINSHSELEKEFFRLLIKTKDLRERLNLNVLVETEALQSKLKSNANEMFALLPMFHSVRFTQQKELLSSNGKKVATLLSASVPRGLGELVKLMDYIELNEPDFLDKVLFRVRVFQETNENKNLVSLIEDRVEVYRGAMNETQFEQFVMSSDVMLLPYLKSNFELNTSGVFSDAVMNDIPVVSTRETWAGYHTHRLKNGQTFIEGNTKQFFHALKEVVCNIDEYKNKASEVRGVWSEYHSPKNLENIFKIEVLANDNIAKPLPMRKELRQHEKFRNSLYHRPMQARRILKKIKHKLFKFK